MANEIEGAAPDETVLQGGINQGQGTGTDGALNDSDPKDALLRRSRQKIGDLVDDNAASHQGGIGVQSGQADFGSAGNLAGLSGIPDTGATRP